MKNLVLFLLLACGKPTDIVSPDIDPTKTQFGLNASIRYNPYVKTDGQYQTIEYGWYLLPVTIRSMRVNRGGGWVHIEHDGKMYCYVSNGIVDYTYHHRQYYSTTKECDRDSDLEDVPDIFYVTWKLPVYLRIETENCKNCQGVEVSVTIIAE